MTTPTLKIAKLKDRTPIKLPITVDPELMSDLQAYAQIYEDTYGDKQPVASLVPLMLSGFLASDAGFKKAKREITQS